MQDDTLFRIVPIQAPNARQIALLRQICNLGIAEIRHAAASQASIRDMVVFGPGWAEERLLLGNLSRLYSQGDAPFHICETLYGDQAERLSPEAFASRLEHYRAIELEQQMLSDLENGHIPSPDAFKPHDDDWV